LLNAIRQGKFHIWPVRSIDEGIEVLTGVPAGVRLDDGSFEPGSVNALVNQRLQQMAETLQRFGKETPAKTPDAQKNNEVDKANDPGDGE
jgi:predicted ATP-dependent protease